MTVLEREGGEIGELTSPVDRKTLTSE